ncbi:MAG: addiction module protein [Spirochaetaceae bacterium]|nr:addiction module protein [Spirochaetaceae bacterium]
MSERSQSVIADALALPPLERAEVIDRLYQSLRSEREREIESAWAEESERRIDAYLAGEADTVPYEQIKRQLSQP